MLYTVMITDKKKQCTEENVKNVISDAEVYSAYYVITASEITKSVLT